MWVWCNAIILTWLSLYFYCSLFTQHLSCMDLWTLSLPHCSPCFLCLPLSVSQYESSYLQHFSLIDRVGLADIIIPFSLSSSLHPHVGLIHYSMYINSFSLLFPSHYKQHTVTVWNLQKQMVLHLFFKNVTKGREAKHTSSIRTDKKINTTQTKIKKVFLPPLYTISISPNHLEENSI